MAVYKNGKWIATEADLIEDAGFYICDNCGGEFQGTKSAEEEVEFLEDHEFMDRHFGPEILPDWLKPLYAERTTGWVCVACFDERHRPGLDFG